jgi:hypothetical protein
VLIGAQHQTEWLEREIELDEGGFTLTSRQLGTLFAQREPRQALGRDRSWSKPAGPACSRSVTSA